ncbi:HAMP domain-containing histidine kinase [Paenibacillus pasadenensis]|uniref:sensor histidine kinase n=1 Tax=Paenibacillus pasadenensis TaxID=217090 RepID=UPI00203FABB4|nr:HAMP domain-containing sensor histidine kinase [Paenibacillus pasadenensis]MCM3746625.1 HAMP domain-containing histidine kinase [Paenibacillus pasadenensis]
MKDDNVVKDMTLRLLLHVALSAALSVITSVLLVMVIERLARQFPALRQMAHLLIDQFGDFTLVIMAIILFLLYLLLLQMRQFRYFRDVSRSVRYIADGNFNYQVPVRQKNELGDLASYINYLVHKLQISLDEERLAEQTKSDLITNVSHDLRTPLTSIIGYLGLIEQDRCRDEVELRQYVHIAYEKSKRLNVLINDLFDYTKMRYETSPQRIHTFNLTELLGQLLVQYRVPLEQAGLTGALHAPSGKLPITGDSDKIVRVFENLLANAIHYGKDGGKVDLHASAEEGEAVVEVVNYGEMIPSVDLPHLFDRFYRVDKARGLGSGGSGLGLAIAKSIVEQHGGKIAAASDPFLTSFQVRLPLLSQEALPGKQTKESSL